MARDLAGWQGMEAGAYMEIIGGEVKVTPLHDYSAHTVRVRTLLPKVDEALSLGMWARGADLLAELVRETEAAMLAVNRRAEALRKP